MADRDWALPLFGKSVLKQRKLAEVADLLGPTEGLRCLDLGSDNGVVSLLLRERGGSWASADLTEEAVASIRGAGGDRRAPRGGSRPPALRRPDASTAWRSWTCSSTSRTRPPSLAELARVTKPGGRLVVNTPHLKRTLLRRLRHAIGQTDEKHGHLRPGYTPERLASCSARPSRSEPTARTRASSPSSWTPRSTGAWSASGKKGSAKGMVVTRADSARHEKMFRAYSAIYPFVWAVSRLDALVPASGYMLIAGFRRNPN